MYEYSIPTWVILYIYGCGIIYILFGGGGGAASAAAADA